jgi:hypothetical protein
MTTEEQTILLLALDYALVDPDRFLSHIRQRPHLGPLPMSIRQTIAFRYSMENDLKKKEDNTLEGPWDRFELKGQL